MKRTVKDFSAPSATGLGGALVGNASKRFKSSTVTLGKADRRPKVGNGVTHHIQRAAMMLLFMLLTATTAMAARLIVNITYDGLTESDATVKVTRYVPAAPGEQSGYETKTVTNGWYTSLDTNYDVTVAVASSQYVIGTAFSATAGGANIAVTQTSNNCSFVANSTGNTVLNITITKLDTSHLCTVHFTSCDGGTMPDQIIGVDVPTHLAACTFIPNATYQHNFFYWLDNKNHRYANGEIVTNLAPAGGEITLSAIMIPGWNVHYDANGGEGTMYDQGNAGDVTLNDNTYTREDYVFKNWNTAADGSGNSFEDGAYVLVKNLVAEGETVTLYAQWAPTYYVHFNANGGTGTMADQVIKVDATAALAACTFTREGYYLAGWNTAANGGGASYADGASVTNLATTPGATVTLYAQWREIVQNCSINMPTSGTLTA